MGLLETILGKLEGDIQLYIHFKKKPVAEVLIDKDQITVDVKNPVLAIEVVLNQLRKKKVSSSTLKRLKEMKYKVKVKYKGLEFEV